MTRPRHSAEVGALVALARWARREPVRLRLYAVLGAIVALLVYRGVVDQAEGPLWLALGAALLGIVGTETAREKVTPVADPRLDE